MDVEHEESHAELVQRVSKAPSPEWIYSYFKLVDGVLSETGLTNDDPRLLMSIPQAGTLPVTVNNRYVLTAFRGEPSRTEFILPPTKKSEPYIEQADYTVRFDPIYGEAESESPRLVGFDGIPNRIVDEEFWGLWMSAVDEERERAEKAPQRRYHDPLVYRAARDRTYREKVIREAFEQD